MIIMKIRVRVSDYFSVLFYKKKLTKPDPREGEILFIFNFIPEPNLLIIPILHVL